MTYIDQQVHDLEVLYQTARLGYSNRADFAIDWLEATADDYNAVSSESITIVRLWLHTMDHACATPVL